MGRNSEAVGMPRLFVFGLGYTANALALRLAAAGWQVTGTSRDGGRGTIAFDDETDTLTPVDRQRHVVRGFVIMMRQEILERCLAGAGLARPEEYRGDALAHEVVMVRAYEEALRRIRIRG